VGLTRDDPPLKIVAMSAWNNLFFSREVCDIIAHFTPDEAAGYRELGQNLGGQFGSRVVGPGAVVTVLVSGSTARGFPHTSSLLILAGFACLFFVIAHFLARPVRQRMRAYLCSTEYAQRTGYRVESLPLSRLGIG
jgi:hypothetical protein